MNQRIGKTLRRQVGTRTARGLLALGVAASVTAAGISAAGAATARFHRSFGGLGHPVAAGTVTVAPSGGAFTITTRKGATIVVDVGTTTTYAEQGVATPSLSNVTLGELVAVFGTASSSTVTATEVIVWAPHGGLGSEPAIAGTVSVAPSGTSFSVLTRAGTTYVIDTSSTTTYTESGVTAPTLTNVTLGERVAVFGTTSASTVTATAIAIDATTHGFVTAGTVATPPDSTGVFTITTWAGTTITVDTATTTTYTAEGLSAPTILDVKTGVRLAVFGSVAGTTVSATQVAIEEPPLAHTNFATAGLVTTAPVGSAPTTFVITSWSKTPITVNVSTSTTFVEFGVTTPTLANVTAGEFVGIVGTLSGSTVTATQVVIAGSQGHGLLGIGHHGRGDGGFGWGEGGGHSHGGFFGTSTGTTVSGTATGPNPPPVSGTSTGPDGHGFGGFGGFGNGDGNGGGHGGHGGFRG